MPEIEITGKITRIHSGYVNNQGKTIRDIDVTAKGKNKLHFYRLTEVEEQPRRLQQGMEYCFKLFLNGINHQGEYKNSLLIYKTRIHPSQEK
nr:hypothetical protein [Cytophagales bacterium]